MGRQFAGVSLTRLVAILISTLLLAGTALHAVAAESGATAPSSTTTQEESIVEWNAPFRNPNLIAGELNLFPNWVEPIQFIEYVVFAERDQLDQYLSCLALSLESPESRRTRNCLLGLNSGRCLNDDCSGTIIGRELVNFDAYALVQDYEQLYLKCVPSTIEDFPDCAEQVGCLVGNIDSVLWVECPTIVLQKLEPLTIDPKFWANVGLGDCCWPAGEELDSPSIVSKLPRLVPPDQVLPKAGAASAASLVFTVLVMLPTRLLNSTLEANSSRIKIWFGIAFSRLFPTREDKSRHRTSPRFSIPKPIQGFAAFALASIIAGFAEPDFGLNPMSFRLLISAFLSFLILNLVSTVFVWRLFRRRGMLNGPRIKVQYGYLALITGTVLLSRLLQLDPVIVFGVVLALESGRVVSTSQQQIRELEGKTSFVSLILTLLLGVTLWSVLSLTLLREMGGDFWQLMIRELTVILIIEALATLPLAMMPIKFMPGNKIFQWNRWAWAGATLLSLITFVFILVPLPDSWESVSVSIWSWMTVLGGYSLLAIIVWAFFGWSRKIGRVST